MARYHNPVCRLCRREGEKLFLKGDRCYTEKCAIERREYGPGIHGQSRRTKLSEYGVQLREKQKVKTVYGLLERQFRLTFERAERMKGVTGHNLLKLLESRIDNLVYRSGFANSRTEARLLITQNHFMLNNRRADIPSMIARPGDVLAVREKSRQVTRIQAALDASERRGTPEWLDVSRTNFTATLRAWPERGQITTPINENLIVELYSK